MDKALELSEAGMLPERQYMQVRILPGSPLCAPFHDPVAEWIRRWILTRLEPSGRGAVTNQLMQVRILPGSLLFVFNACCNAISMLGPSFTLIARPCGLMDKALVFGTKDCRLESCQGHFFPLFLKMIMRVLRMIDRPHDRATKWTHTGI